MKYLKMAQTSVVIFIFAIIGMSVAVHVFMRYLGALIIIAAVIGIFGLLIGRRSPF